MADNIFLLHGENTFASQEKLNLWKQGFMKKYGEDGNIETFDSKNINPGEFETNLQTLPFLCEKRMIILQNIFSNEIQKRISEMLNKLPDFCIIIFHETGNADKRTSLFKTITKIGKVEEFPKLDPFQTSNWIIERSKKINLNIDRNTATFLSQFAGSNLWKLSGELNKLKSFAENKPISQEDIKNLIRPSLSTSIFNFTDNLSQKNIQKSINILKELTDQGEELIMIFFMVVRQFRILIQIKSLISQGLNEQAITKNLKLHPFVVKKTYSQTRNYSLDKLKKIYQNLLQIDIDTKSGIINISKNDTSELELAIEKLIIQSTKD